jgi:long-chain acyl-CoA synthetase
MQAKRQHNSETVSPGSSFRSILVSHGVRAAAVRHPDKDALVCGTAARTYRQLVARLNRIHNAAAEDLGLCPGDHVAVLSENRFEYIEILLAMGDLGVATATPNPRLTERELHELLLDCEAKVVFAEAALAERINLAELPLLGRIIIFGEDFEDWLACSSDRPRAALAEEWHPFCIPYTSGTTGRPKGVLVSHRARTQNILAMAVEYGCYGPEDRFLSTTPMCHGAGFTFLYGSLFFGGTGEFIRGFDPEETLALLRRNNSSGVFLVPTQFHKIFSLGDAVLDRYRDNRLKTIISNAAPLPQATKEQIVEYFGDGKLFECYGSTEGGIVTNLRPADQLRKRKCVGHPFFATFVKLLDENHEEVGPGEIGELFTTGPALFNGYWQRPEETANAFLDGWVTVGDMAMRDDEGYYYIVDRNKDMVITGGVNVYPREIEEVLAAIPGIVEAAVIAAPDATWGERLVAHVVLGDEATLTAQDIQTHCAADLASFKVPKEVVFEDELPRNLSGKILKRELRDRWSA